MPSRILIAEDDHLQGSLLMAAIACRGHEVDVVADGLEAVRRLRTGRYDLAVLDYSLPELCLVVGVLGGGILYSGVTALRAFRRHSPFAMPTVTLRSHGEEPPSVQPSAAVAACT